MTTVDNANKINPHMKFTPPPLGVIPTPEIYKYSLRDELIVGENQLKQLNNKIHRNYLKRFAENHPNLKSNIWGVIKLTGVVLGAWMSVRYRHSIPFLKDICKAPKNPPPNFKQDMQKIWDSFLEGINK